MRPVISQAYHLSGDLATLVTLLALMSMAMSCTTTGSSNESKTRIRIEGYNINHPDRIFRLPYELQEISGLSYYKDSVLVGIQDEKGKLYFYDYNRGVLLDDFKFAKGGDYEGVEHADSMIYVVKSNGELYAIHISTKEVSHIKTPLKSKNDIEGLGYDPASGQLILACKESPVVGKYTPKGKAIYSYDLYQRRLIEKPLLTITKNDISKASGYKIEAFKPSGVAISPLTGYLYIVAHAGKQLVILDRSHRIINTVTLKNKLFGQPEGICFTPDGDLLISNEGKDARATLLYYQHQANK